MKIRRSPKATYVAAFLLGGLIALLIAAPARAAEAFRLDRIPIVRFTALANDQLQLRTGVLNVSGEVVWRITQTIARPANTPEWALDRNLVNVTTWFALHSLGGLALVDFEVHAGGVHADIGDQSYFVVAPLEGAVVATGKVVNISTRTKLPLGDVVIAGFVIADRPRAVLVRAVGPSLARFNVPSPTPDPWLTIKRGSTSIVGNDDWSNQSNSDLIVRAAARVGAFPLDLASYDAAQLVIIPPGAYTVHVGTDRIDVQAGEVLVEIYGVPEDVFD
jgi:hypothetical protein